VKSHQFHLATEAETRKFAEDLSLFLQAGMIVTLSGDLGAGKSTFARALIKALAKSDQDFDVPSPTFSLIQTYDMTRVPVVHVDLYRTKTGAEVKELGLAELAANHLLIVEWPNSGIPGLDSARLQLEFSGSGNSRDVEVTAVGACTALISRFVEIQTFLKQHNFRYLARKYLDGDASSRRYERLQNGTSKFILMDMPAKPDGPPVKDGKPYSAIAHLAEGLRSVVAMNDLLVERGFAAPRVLACDISAGLAVIEDFGDAIYGRLRAAGEPMREPMAAAVEVLNAIAGQPWPAQFRMRDGSTYTMQPYDLEAQLIEVDLLVSWFLPHINSKPPTESEVTAFHEFWTNVLPLTKADAPVWVLRDFHSPNLIWRPEQTGVKRVGLIDTQDALLGHPAYDLVSLLQDARIDIPVDEERGLLAHYLELRKAAGNFDVEEFKQAYAILGAQRATKILGIFARLAKRDGKLGYLKHIPRVSRYLNRNLQHPSLSALRRWFERNLPEAIEGNN
jgi:tRNA threonylcarbamoyl adenosine modification protein YjeE